MYVLYVIENADATPPHLCLTYVSFFRMPRPGVIIALQDDLAGVAQLRRRYSSNFPHGAMQRFVSSAASLPSVEQAATETAKWQVEFPSGWTDLPSEASRDIEAALHDGKAEAEYTQCRSQKQGRWDLYRIVFSTMQQENIRSGRIRAARRVMEPAPHIRADESEVPRAGVWEEPQVEKKGANKILRR